MGTFAPLYIIFFGISLTLWLAIKFYKVYQHPTSKLTRHATSKGWVAAGITTDTDGFRMVKLGRRGIVIGITHKNSQIMILKPVPSGPFDSWLEFESFLDSFHEPADIRRQIISTNTFASNTSEQKKGLTNEKTANCEQLIATELNRILSINGDIDLWSEAIESLEFPNEELKKTLHVCCNNPILQSLYSVIAYRTLKTFKKSPLVAREFLEDINSYLKLSFIEPPSAFNEGDIFHERLDALVNLYYEITNSFFEQSTFKENQKEFLAESLLFLSFSISKNMNDVCVGLIEWNTFKSAFENRLINLNIIPFTNHNHALNETNILVSRVSPYYEILDHLDALISRNFKDLATPINFILKKGGLSITSNEAIASDVLFMSYISNIILKESLEALKLSY